MKNILILLVLISLPGITKAQFKAGEHFVAGGFGISLIDTKFRPGVNTIGNHGQYSHNIGISLGHFTTDNRAVGWTLDQSLSLFNYGYYDSSIKIKPRSLTSLRVGIGRFVEYYKPISEKLALYISPSLGLTYELANTWGQDSSPPGISYQTQTNTLILGASLAAGIAWRITPKWALYGNFAFTNPISISGGISNTVNYQEKNPQGENLKTRGSLFEYNFSPTLSSGSIGLGFRYFYTRKNSNS